MASKYGKEQKEGLARLLDALAAAAFIGGVVGASGHSPLVTLEIIALFATCPILLVISWKLRKPT